MTPMFQRRILRTACALFLGVVAASAAAAEASQEAEDLLGQLELEAVAAREAALERLVDLSELPTDRLREALAAAGPRARPLVLELAGRRVAGELAGDAAALTLDEDPAVRDAAVRALVRMGESAVITGLARLADPQHAATARRLRALDAQHRVEKALLSKWRHKAGSYKGRYADLAELGWPVQPVLLAMLVDVPLEDRFVIVDEARSPEHTARARKIALVEILLASRRGYRTFEKLPSKIQTSELFGLAVDALRDVADLDLMGDILESLAEDLRRADKEANYFLLRRFEQAYAQSIAGVLHSRGRPRTLETWFAEALEKEQSARGRAWGDPERRHYLALMIEDCAALLHQMEAYDASAARYREIVEIRADLTGEVPAVACYNLACSLSLAGHKEEALDALERSLAAGAGAGDLTAEWVAEDGDLRPLHSDPRFRKILDRYFGSTERPESSPDTPK